MKKRGKILRDTSAGPGLVMAEGQQYTFSLEGMWRSPEAPRVGMVTDVEFDDDSSVRTLTLVPESQLAKEQAEAVMAAARERGSALASGAVAKFGMPSLIAGGLIVIGWWMLPAVSVTVPFAGSMHFTLWQVLGFLGSSNIMEVLASRGSGSTGIYGLLAIAAVVAPFLHHVWNDKRAWLGGLAPLLFMVLIGLLVRSALHTAMGGSVGAGANDPALGDFARQAQDEAMKAISLGAGIYVSALASLYFAVTSTKRFLVTSASDAHGYDKSPRMVA